MKKDRKRKPVGAELPMWQAGLSWKEIDRRLGTCTCGSPKGRGPHEDGCVVLGRTLVINNVTQVAPEVPEGWELSTQVISKKAPWYDDGNAPTPGMNPRPDVPPVAALPPEYNVDAWRRGDMVSVKMGDKELAYEQLLVAADNPEVNLDECWLVVADENDWNAVGTFKHRDYLVKNHARRIFNRADQAKRQDEPTIKPRPTPPPPPRSAVLLEAEQLITGDRNKSYGSPTENFQNTADIWTIQVRHLLKEGAKFEAAHVAQLMMGLKLARLVAAPKRDNYVDIAGYAGCGWECEEAAINAAKATAPRRANFLVPDEWYDAAAVKRAEREAKGVTF